ncbi:MAG: hypothetical protein JW751_31755 [Polyangiaceae bacterium]|nr:hypothetical protein [Polyangiaceae bacterium]
MTAAVERKTVPAPMPGVPEPHPPGAAPENSDAEVLRVARGIRRRVLEHTLRHHGGYLSQACSSAETLAALYLRVMRLGPSEGPLVPPPFSGVPGPNRPKPWSGRAYNGPLGPDLDRFIFSPVHYALVLYSLLIELGRLGPDALLDFNRDGSTVEMIGAEHSPGHEVTAGSLGQALSQAGGIALGRRLKGERGRVWVYLSDGELEEGQIWEAVNALAHHRLGNLGVYVDVNAQQCDGAMDTVMKVEPLAERLRAFGAEVREVDGHDVTALVDAARPWSEDRPLFVLARTDPCHGLPVLRRRAPRLHYVRLANESERQELVEALREL